MHVIILKVQKTKKENGKRYDKVGCKNRVRKKRVMVPGLATNTRIQSMETLYILVDAYCDLLLR